MANDLRERAWAVFDQLADVPAEQREAVLRAACGEDLALRTEVERLLALDDRLAPAEPLPAPAAQVSPCSPPGQLPRPGKNSEKIVAVPRSRYRMRR